MRAHVEKSALQIWIEAFPLCDMVTRARAILVPLCATKICFLMHKCTCLLSFPSQQYERKKNIEPDGMSVANSVSLAS